MLKNRILRRHYKRIIEENPEFFPELVNNHLYLDENNRNIINDFYIKEIFRESNFENGLDFSYEKGIFKIYIFNSVIEAELNPAHKKNIGIILRKLRKTKEKRYGYAFHTFLKAEWLFKWKPKWFWSYSLFSWKLYKENT